MRFRFACDYSAGYFVHFSGNLFHYGFVYYFVYLSWVVFHYSNIFDFQFYGCVFHFLDFFHFSRVFHFFDCCDLERWA